MIRIHRADPRSSAEVILNDPARPLSAQQFNALSFDARLALVRSAQGRRKADLLLDAVDGERLVAHLPAQDFYLLIRELGANDSGELLALATTEQLTACLDLDGWDGDSFDAVKGGDWLQHLLEAGEEKVLRTVGEMELELLGLLLKKQLTILHGPEDIEDEDVRFEAMHRNGGYELEYRHPEQAKVVAAFLDILFRNDQETFLRLLEIVRWETEPELEESAYGYHCGRMLDLGFPPPETTQSLYAWLDPERFTQLATPKRPAVSYGDEPPVALAVLAAARPQGLLATALAAGIDEALALELAGLANKALQAARVDPGEPETVRNAADAVYAGLNLALEFLCRDDPAGAGQTLRAYYLEDLFRLGFSLLLRLQRRARLIAAAPIAPFLDGPFRAGVEALGRERPAYYLGIDQPERSGERPFRSAAELAAATAWLDGIEAQRHFFEQVAPFALPTATTCDLAGCEPERLDDLTLSDLLLTALANRLLERDFQPRPIAATELPALHRRLSRDGALDAVLRRETIERFEREVPGLGRYIDWALSIWDDGFCALAPESLDPRYIDGLIVRRA